MKKKDLVLTAVLLVMIGITMGTLIALYTINEELAPLAEVRTTEINKSSDPFISDEDLSNADARFLFKKVAEEVTPTVVYIEAIVPVDNALTDEDNSEFEEDESLWDKIMPRRARTVGSGVLITDDGYILTNHHVISGAVKRGIRVILSDKREYSAKVVGYDTSTDLAVIKINASNMEAITVGDSETLAVGEWVLAIGNPFRLQSTVTAGIVSALGRDVQIINDRLRIESFIQTDAAINKGNSGGALVNTSGQLVGINTAIASQSGSYQGYGFAVPSNLAIKIAQDLIEYGEVRRVLLGVTIAAVDYERALEKGMDSVRGVEILSVDGSAKEAGVVPGDIVLEVNGKMVNESNALQQQVAVLSPGETAELLVWRDGKEITIEVPLEYNREELLSGIPEQEQPELFEEEFEGEGLGVVFKEFDLGFRIMAIAKPEDPNAFDLIVTRVQKYSEAWNRGLREEYQIVEVEKEKVEHLSTLEDLIHENLTTNGSVTLGIVNDDDARGYIELKNE